MPVIMGVINLTPDSFYSGSRSPSVQESVDKAGEMIEEGAGILDIGAMSTRPGSEEITAEEELKRLVPPMLAIRKNFRDVFLSVDTYRAKIAEEVIEMGADMINDISGGTFDALMFDTIARLNVPYVLMHTAGKPNTMQENPVYKDVLAEVKTFFTTKLQNLNQKGITQVILDPGFGFGKTIDHNYRLLAGLKLFAELKHPLLVGISRKSMINEVLRTSPSNALNGTTVLNTIALMNGADILRVHDVKEAVECRQLVSAYKKLGHD